MSSHQKLLTIKSISEKLLEICRVAEPDPQFSQEEVAQHKTPASCWLVAGGSVYDVTAYLQRHPGGANILLKRAGGPDCQQDLDFHRQQTRGIWKALKIGVLKPS